MKIPISVMRKLNVTLIIFLDDILIMASTKKELLQARDPLIFLLQTLGFLVNKNKSVLHPCQILQFLVVEINSKECQGILREKSVSIRELTQVLGRRSSTAIAVLAAPLQYLAVQRQQIAELAITKNFDSMIVLTEEARKELQWWVENLQLTKGKTLINSQPQITISTDASLEGWGAYCQGQKTGGPWTSQEKKDHINVLELRAVKYTILTFSRLHPKAQAIHIQMDSIVALSYLVKMGGTRNKSRTVLSKEIWDYLLSKEITITAEYLPGLLNVEADTQSRTARDTSECKLNPRIFQKICKYRGAPEIDLFAS